MHHLLSRLELAHFQRFACESSVVDIQEQFPLELERTQRIAIELRAIHPGLRISDVEAVMTTDLLVTRETGGKRTQTAYSVKWSHEAQTEINQEKFAIEKAYWAPEVELVPLSERDLSLEEQESAEWILQATWPDFLSDVTEGNRFPIAEAVRVRLQEPSAILFQVADAVDGDRVLPAGTALDVVRWMVAEGHWIPAGGCFPFPSRPLILKAVS